MPETSMVPAVQASRDAATMPRPRPMRAPSSESAAMTARSPWRLWESSPVTESGSVPSAPAASQKAALDQSPSTAQARA